MRQLLNRLGIFAGTTKKTRTKSLSNDTTKKLSVAGCIRSFRATLNGFQATPRKESISLKKDAIYSPTPAFTFNGKDPFTSTLIKRGIFYRKLECFIQTTINATVPAGGKVAAVWQQWTHSQGPILVWLYKCYDAFSSYTGDGAGWLKIDEAGFHGDGVKIVGGGKWESTIPQDLAPGNYLMRHELVALHQANNPQFYPECAQIVLTESGTAKPDSSYKAAIPGYCNQSDSNIKVPINDHSLPRTYKVPDPPSKARAAPPSPVYLIHLYLFAYSGGYCR
ncbi:glycosyl hydrolase family 61-domain-containing protein [Schizothecium vesticola]|uniref:lytic cellulose monooxygenase (C4-dehydrogenating) n=1 Tax=Schizothecium vesticola TaxID=314040 RepID=A0AA40BR49_9PEZI|nr:glycosyl hydrolase family 61-domain-containing protein [Schizothecium vesticola]